MWTPRSNSLVVSKAVGVVSTYTVYYTYPTLQITYLAEEHLFTITTCFISGVLLVGLQGVSQSEVTVHPGSLYI